MHDHCQHEEVSWCGHCQVVYCKKCPKEWGERAVYDTTTVNDPCITSDAACQFSYTCDHN